jgi:hypothetical protein
MRRWPTARLDSASHLLFFFGESPFYHAPGSACETLGASALALRAPSNAPSVNDYLHRRHYRVHEITSTACRWICAFPEHHRHLFAYRREFQAMGVTSVRQAE